jgi:hypothetical protein
LKIVTRSLSRNLPVKVSLRILLTPLIGLIDRYWNESGTEQFDNVGMSKRRRTVEYSVVSCAAEWVSVHGPDENWFAFGDRNFLSLQQGNSPRDRTPQFISGRLQLPVKLLESLFCQLVGSIAAGLESCQQECGQQRESE